MGTSPVMDDLQVRRRKRKTIDALRDGKAKNLSQAAACVRVSPSMVSRWRRDDPQFRVATDELLSDKAGNVATKTGRRAIAEQIESMCYDLERVFTAEHGRPFGEPVTKPLTDELLDIAERLRE